VEYKHCDARFPLYIKTALLQDSMMPENYLMRDSPLVFATRFPVPEQIKYRFTLRSKGSYEDPLNTPVRVPVITGQEHDGTYSRAPEKILGIFLLFTAPAGDNRIRP
jgi:hypothetical protein